MQLKIYTKLKNKGPDGKMSGGRMSGVEKCLGGNEKCGTMSFYSRCGLMSDGTMSGGQMLENPLLY